jgi:hypothetical protein
LAGPGGRASVGAYGHPHAILLPLKLTLSRRKGLSLAGRMALLRWLLWFRV